MVTDKTQTTIKRVPWEPKHDTLLAVSAGTLLDLDIVREQVQNGIAVLWECHSGIHTAFVVTRRDVGNELCVVLFEGSGLKVFGPLILNAAHDAGLTVRAHVKRKGMIRIAESLGMKLDEFVVRKYYGQ